MILPETYITDANDAIVGDFTTSFDKVTATGFKELQKIENKIPVVVRGMTERKVIHLCEQQKRDYYYIDTGYMGNLSKRKDFHRVVKNNVQNMSPRYDLPEDRFLKIPGAEKNIRFKGWLKNDGPILVVTPSAKPCNFYDVDRDKWVYDTVHEIQKHTDREIIIRDKGSRRERLGDNSVPAQLVRDNIFCLVTYNSIAATEAISTGVPAIALAPGAANELCTKKISQIETPYYPDEEVVVRWQNWLAYCNYTTTELRNGTALGIIEELELC
jgi:hypothetical protein